MTRLRASRVRSSCKRRPPHEPPPPAARWGDAVKILIACEHSGRVRSAFRALGHEAWSCDIVSSDDEGDHFRTDVRSVLSLGIQWDLVIAFPPCTHLCNSGSKHWPAKRLDGRMQQGVDFFLEFTRLTCPWAIENPVGIMSTRYRKPDQIIQPYQFGDSAKKTTCLWLNRLPKLIPTNVVSPGEMHVLPDGRNFPKWMVTKGRHRQVTFLGIAKAMAEQWSVALAARVPA
jgi:hypothetical protein